MERTDWPKEFDERAARQGWNVYSCDGGPHDGKLRIQRVDDMGVYEWHDGDGEPLFKDDEQAIRFVRKLAKKGEPHALAALAMHNTKVILEEY